MIIINTLFKSVNRLSEFRNIFKADFTNLKLKGSYILHVIIMPRTSFRVNQSTLYSLPECEANPRSKQASYLKFK